jgi:putative FmdB family regulatory protein
MPIYEYICERCKTRYERVVLSKNGTPECPECGSRKAVVQFSVFATHSGNGGKAAARETAAPASSCGCTARGCGCH